MKDLKARLKKYTDAENTDQALRLQMLNDVFDALDESGKGFVDTGRLLEVEYLLVFHSSVSLPVLPLPHATASLVVVVPLFQCCLCLMLLPLPHAATSPL